MVEKYLEKSVADFQKPDVYIISLPVILKITEHETSFATFRFAQAEK